MDQKSKMKPKMTFEEILVHIGEFGIYQRSIYFLVCLMILPVACHQLAQVFLVAQVNHRCRVPGLENENCSSWLLQITDNGPEDGALPEECKDLKQVTFSPCEVYNLSSSDGSWNSFTTRRNAMKKQKIPDVDNSTTTIECTHGWVYDTSQYKSTIVTNFNLVCNKEDLPSYSTSIYFSGVLIGTFVFGCIADRIGRYPTLFACLFIQLTVGIGIAFARNFWMFVWLRFLLATVNMSIFILVFVIGTEFVGPSWRAFTGMGVEFFFAFGYMILGIMAYFIRDWRTLQLAISVPVALFFLCMPVVPESARWLITHGKFDKARRLLKKVSTVNGKELPDYAFLEEENIQEKKNSPSPADVKRKPVDTVIDLFKTPELRKESVNLMFNTLANNLVYYGISMSTASLGVNHYAAFVISGAVEIPGFIFGLFAINRLGRRSTLCISMLVSGIACMVTTVIPIGVGRTIVAMIAKAGISSSFGIIYIYPAECFPTTVRTAGVGMCSMCGRLGGILAPLVIVLTKYWQPLPFLVLGCVSAFAGLLALLLPETMGKKLPETMKEGEELGRTDPGFALPWKRTTPTVIV